MSDSSDLVVRVSQRGTTVHRVSDPPTLVGAADLPGGGSLVLDLARPATVVALFLTDAHWSALEKVVNASTDLDDVARRLERRVSEAALPDAWLRLALVEGLVRWYADPLDEALLAADLAAAQAAAGLLEEAEATWERAEPAVTRLLGEPLDPGIHAELTWVLAAVGSDVVPLAPRVGEPTADVVVYRSRRYRSRSVRSLPVERNLRPVLDPRNLPSRVVVPAEARLEPVGSGVVVSVTAAAGGNSVDDLVAVAYDDSADAPRELGRTTLTHEGDDYRGLLAGAELAEQVRTNAVVVELRSAGSVHQPLLEVREAEQVREAQKDLVRARRERVTAGDDSSYARPTLAERVGA